MKLTIDFIGGKWAPSWVNYQEKIIQKIANEGVNGFVYNINTLKSAKGVAVLSFVKGKSGKLDETEYATSTCKSISSIGMVIKACDKLLIKG